MTVVEKLVIGLHAELALCLGLLRFPTEVTVAAIFVAFGHSYL